MITPHSITHPAYTFESLTLCACAAKSNKRGRLTPKGIISRHTIAEDSTTMKRFSTSICGGDSPPRRPRPQYLNLEGASSKGYTAKSLQGRILDGWHGRAEDPSKHASLESEGLIVLAIDVTGSMSTQKQVLSDNLTALCNTLSVVSNGLNIAVVFYTDFDGDRKEPVVWSPYTMDWTSEEIAEAIEKEKCAHGGGTGCEAFDVAFLYIIKDLVPVYRKLVNNGDTKATIVINITDEDMRTYCEATEAYGKTSLNYNYSDYLGRYRDPEIAKIPDVLVGYDHEGSCIKAMDTITSRWGKMFSKNEILDICYTNDIFLRTFNFLDTHITVYGYKKFCDDTMDRFELFCFDKYSTRKLTGMLCAIVYRFFIKIHSSMSSSYLLAEKQEIINTCGIDVPRLKDFVNIVRDTATEAQITDLNDRILKKDSLCRRGIQQYNNTTHRLNSCDSNIFLSSFVDRHMFVGANQQPVIKPMDTDETDRTYNLLANDGHMASILANISDRAQNGEIKTYLEKMDERVKAENCCKNCAEIHQPGTDNHALARWFAHKMIGGMETCVLMRECAMAIPDAIGSIYKFICSNAPRKCSTINRLCTEFMKRKDELTAMIKKSKHDKDQNMDMVSRINRVILRGDHIENVDYWFYLVDTDELKKWADEKLEEATGGNVDVYKRFEHPICFEVVRKTVADHLRVLKASDSLDIRNLTPNVKIAPSDRLLALPMTLKENKEKDESSGDCMFIGEKELTAFPAEKALPLIMSLVGKNQSISNPMLISGLKCVATIATALTENDARATMLKKVLLNMSSKYLDVVFGGIKSRDVFSLVFNDDGTVERDNLTNRETLNTLCEWALLLKRSKRDLEQFPVAIKAYSAISIVKKCKLFDDMKYQPVNVIEIDNEQMVRCKNCGIESLKGTDMANHEHCSWCFSPERKGKGRFDELLKKTNLEIEYRKEEKCPDEDKDDETNRIKEWRVMASDVDSCKVTQLMNQGKEKEVLEQHLDKGDFVSIKTAEKVFKKMFKGSLLANFQLQQQSTTERTAKSGGDRVENVVVFPKAPDYKCVICNESCPGRWLRKKQKCNSCRYKGKEGRNPGSVLKWVFDYGTCVKDTRLQNLESGLNHSTNNKKRFAKDILINYMDKGSPVSLDTAEKVVKLMFAKTMLSEDAMWFLRRKIREEQRSSTNANTTSTVSLTPYLRLRCSICREDYKGSWFSPSKSSKHKCPLCRCSSRLSEEDLETILKNKEAIGFTGDNELMWFLNSIKSKGQQYQQRLSPALSDIKRNDAERFADAEGVDIFKSDSSPVGLTGKGEDTSSKEETEDLEAIMTTIADMDVDEREEGVRYVAGALLKGRDKVRLYGMGDYGTINYSNPVRQGEKIGLDELKWGSVAEMISGLIGGANPEITTEKLTRYWKDVPNFKCTDNSKMWRVAHAIAEGFKMGEDFNIRTPYIAVKNAFKNMIIAI